MFLFDVIYDFLKVFGTICLGSLASGYFFVVFGFFAVGGITLATINLLRS